MALVGACARQGAPPGGPEDRRLPVVVATEPDTFAVVEDFQGPVRFLFDERISERVAGGSLNDAVLVSPSTGTVRVDHGRQGLEVSVAGGFQPGRVYRVTLLPVVRDLFNNEMVYPFELVFSTGAELVPTVVAGRIWDRITGEGAEGLEVRAVSADSTVHVARSDSGGIYALRYLPAERYRLVAFQDRNGNGELDGMEQQGQRPLLVGAGDTLLIDVAVLEPDTTPARVTGAELLDSVTLVIRFDDYLDPEASLETLGVSLRADSLDGGDIGVRRIFHEHEYAAYVEQIADSFARLDSLEAAERARQRQAAAARDPSEGEAAQTPDSAQSPDTTRAPDTAQAEPEAEAAPPRPVRRPPPRLEGARTPARGAPGGLSRPGQARQARRPGEALPAQRIVALLEEPPVMNASYQLVVTGVRNINELPLGGGEAAVVRSPPPDTASADSAEAAPDTAATVPGTSAVPPDTSMAPKQGLGAGSGDPWGHPARPQHPFRHDDEGGR